MSLNKKSAGKLALALAPALAGVLAGCTPPPPPAGDPRIAIRGDAGVVLGSRPVVTSTPGGVVTVSVPLWNGTTVARTVQCATVWYDRSAQPIPGLSTFPQRVELAPMTTEYCRTVSPTPDSYDFRITVTPTY